MEKKLNWGLLSTARINRALIKPLKASKRTRLLAVASRSQSWADAYAHEWNIPRAHGSYEALLNDPEIDVIYISLPNHLHAEWTIKALRAGKHVLCEKPFALSLQEVDAMIAAAKESSRVLAEAFMYRHHPQTQMVKESVESGSIGSLQLIKGSFSFRLEGPDDIRNFKNMGGGSIWDVGCYPISYARMIIGEEPLEAFGWQVQGPGGSDEAFIGQIKFPKGILFQFDCSFVTPLRWSMEIIGSKGSLYVPNPFKPGTSSKVINRQMDAEESVKIKGAELYQGEVEDMCDAILHKKPSRVSLEDSRGNIATILTLIDSAEKGMPVLFSTSLG
jgi:xylose dehydrogenase (NAD/NADP)